MHSSKKELWLSIAKYNFENLVVPGFWENVVAQFQGENPFTHAFANKLTRKLDWDHKFALKAIWEYKKFVYLGVISDFNVTPSKIIDQVWHEHLLFTSGYRKFCEEVIEHQFDHHPELVPINSQTEAYQTQYVLTLDLYKKEFSIDPPIEIWYNTKFSGDIEELRQKTVKKKRPANTNLFFISDPLISEFPNATAEDIEFGGGDFGGGGAGTTWHSSQGETVSESSDGDTSCSSGGDSSCGGGCGD